MLLRKDRCGSGPFIAQIANRVTSFSKTHTPLLPKYEKFLVGSSAAALNRSKSLSTTDGFDSTSSLAF